MKKVIGLALATVMALSALTGCSNGSKTPASSGSSAAQSSSSEAKSSEAAGGSEAAQPSGDVTLNMWSMWNSNEPQGEVLQAAADAYKAATGITVNIEWKGREMKNITMAALEGKEKFDIFEDDYARITGNYKAFCYDLTDMAKAAGYDKQSFACFNDVATKNAGFLACVTEQPQVGGIFYNKDIFTDCGISVPTTWDEFMAACKTMKEKGYEPLALDTAYADFIFGYHLDRMIGEEAIKNLALNGGWSKNEGVAKAAQLVIDFVNAGYMADGAPDEYPNSQNKIGLTGKVAMIVCANYVCAEVNATTGANINWGLFNYPAIEGGADPSNAYAGANSLAITSYSEHPQEAFDFLLFLTSGEWDQKMADKASQIPADPSNKAPALMDGTVEVLKATSNPLSWGMGLGENGDKATGIKDVIVKLYEGKYATGEDFAAALDALY